ncbi:Gliding motility protein [Flavobacterium chungbukense]|uniref:Gliding motility protein GldL n=1 Tax=Flavobacterium chungbukense TaxID=877464 RepID=A0ABP7YP83_9FLAO
MSFESIKNISAVTFYFASIISFVLANVLKDNNLSIYYVLLVLGVILFFLGILKRIQTKR